MKGLREMKVNFRGKEYVLVKTKYHVNNRIALILEHNGQKCLTCTVNIDDVSLKQNEVLIKNYSENEGMFKTLIDAKIIEDTKKVHEIDYGTHKVQFPIGKLLIILKLKCLKH